MNIVQNQEVAFIRGVNGEYVIGYGPFESRFEPPEDGVAFYRNDFWDSDPWPWKVPAKVVRVPALSDEWGGDVPEIAWGGVNRAMFARVYDEVESRIALGSLEKAVPVVTEAGVLFGGSLHGLAASLDGMPALLRAYGWLGGAESFIGATPELLLSREGREVRTMALAGTAPRESRAEFEVDVKEVHEHDVVVRAVLERLSPYGRLRALDRGLMELGSMLHFETQVEMALTMPISTGALIKRLHPTPALGASPWTNDARALLRRWRNELGCPSVFGAPFGLSDHGRCSILVAIRMIVQRGRNILLPAGCGVVSGSSFEGEWAELALKREAVKSGFGILGSEPEFGEMPTRAVG